MLQSFEPGFSSVMCSPEPLEISTSYTSIIFHCALKHHPWIDLEALVASMSEANDYFIRPFPESPPVRVELAHLTEPGRWTSNRLVADAASRLEGLIGDPLLGYKVGRWSPHCQAFVFNSLMIPFLGVQRALGTVAAVHGKYSRIKTVEILVNRPGLLKVRKTHAPGAILTYFMILSWIGLFEAYAELAGAASPQVSVEADPREENAYYVEVRYPRTRLLRRLKNRLVWLSLPHHTQQSLIASDRILEEDVDNVLSGDRLERILEMQRCGISAYYAHKIEDVLALINKKPGPAPRVIAE